MGLTGVVLREGLGVVTGEHPGWSLLTSNKWLGPLVALGLPLCYTHATVSRTPWP